jgi:hypothetical protein
MRTVRAATKLAIVPKPPEDVFRIYPESEYDRLDKAALPWLEAGYSTGVFESLPEREDARRAA